MIKPVGRMSLALITLASLLHSIAAFAHDTRPLYVEISEQERHLFAVTWKVPITVAATNVPDITLSDDCRALAPPAITKTTRQQTFRCATDLSNAAVSIHYPRFNPSISSLYSKSTPSIVAGSLIASRPVFSSRLSTMSACRRSLNPSSSRSSLM